MEMKGIIEHSIVGGDAGISEEGTYGGNMSACTVVKLSGGGVSSNRTEEGVRSKMEQRHKRKKRNQEEKLPSGSHRYQKGAEKIKDAHTH